MSSWNPISTAPRDGTQLLLTDGEKVFFGSERSEEWAGPSRGGMPTTGHLFPAGATHWMPVPAFPDKA